jgi:putative transposase
VATEMDETWSMKFRRYSLECGRSYRLLNVIDHDIGKGLGIEVDYSLPSERVIQTLRQLIEWRRNPSLPRCVGIRVQSTSPRL